MINGLKDRLLNISSSAKKIITISACVILTLAVSVGTVMACAKQVVISDSDGSEKKVITFKRYVEEVLSEEEVVLGLNDKMSVTANTELKDGMKIEIYRAYLVGIEENGKLEYKIATQPTAGGALTELGYNPKPTDRITPGFDEKVEEFGIIKFVRVEEETVEVTEVIPFDTKETEIKTMAVGTRKLVQKGAPGEKTVEYKILYEDGVEVSREVLSEKVTVEPITQIREVGPKPKPVLATIKGGTIETSRHGSLAYSDVITLEATAYDASSCGKAPSHPAYGITATGRRAGYGIVAVDPKVIPLGSRLYIENVDGSYIYGTAIAADTGGAIKGNRIDLCYDTRGEAIQFGRKKVKVYILK